MKKILFAVSAVLVILLLALYFLPLGEEFPAETLMGAGVLLLIVLTVVYGWRYGGIRCPNCGCRIEVKYGQRKAFDGRFPCPKCGAMIER